jgi:hypothetical protein
MLCQNLASLKRHGLVFVILLMQWQNLAEWPITLSAADAHAASAVASLPTDVPLDHFVDFFSGTEMPDNFPFQFEDLRKIGRLCVT